MLIHNANMYNANMVLKREKRHKMRIHIKDNKGNKNKMISLRVDTDTMMYILDTCKRRELSITDYIRELIELDRKK